MMHTAPMLCLQGKELGLGTGQLPSERQLLAAGRSDILHVSACASPCSRQAAAAATDAVAAAAHILHVNGCCR